MNGYDIRRFEMLQRVVEFGAAHTDVFPPSSLGGKMFAVVGTSVKDLSQQFASQTSGKSAARLGAVSKAVARANVREHLDAISRTARALAVDTPGLEDKFRLPRNHRDQDILSAARAFAKDARPLAQGFITLEMPSAFLDELNEAIDEFEDATREHGAGTGTHIAAAASINLSLESGLLAVERLDAIVPNRLRDDPATVAVWESARHVERRMPKPPAPLQVPPPGPTHAQSLGK